METNKKHTLKKSAIVFFLLFIFLWCNYGCFFEKNKAHFKINAIPIEMADKMKGVTWKPNCPCSLEELAYLEITYYGFDDKTHRDGRLIVHKKLANEVLKIFEILYQERFPIESIKPMCLFKGDDEAFMEANNTSSFNCREITGKKGVFSKHSYGVAIDINPFQNPYIKGDLLLPSGSKSYLDRSNIRKGMITKQGIVYKTFIKYGWTWGGDWNTRKDYHHFEKEID